MKKLLFVLVLILGSGLLWAQGGARPSVYASLEYFDNPAQIRVTDLTGFTEQTLYFGFVLQPGHTIKTLNSSAEIKLQPNGSIIKIAPNTEIAINALQGLQDGRSNDLSVLGGKVRMVASRLGSPSYTLRTPTAVAGVRGTDFGLEVVPGSIEKLLVRDGSVEFQKNDGTPSAMVGKGQGLDAFASLFAAVPLSVEDLGGFFSELDFEVLSPLDVPEPAVASESTQSSTNTPSTAVNVPAVDTPITSNTDAGTTEESTPTETEIPGWQKALGKLVGLELGSITIDGATYGKAVLQPRFETDGFKLALYLPIIYQDNVFDPNDWYKPAGNSEWSFGSDQNGDILKTIQDASRDLFLKLRYLQIGDQGDPFFVKVANIPSMTLGHGLIIGDYANDADFPAVRRIGLNLGHDGGKNSIELLVNDLANPSVAGLRFMLRPAPEATKAGLGFSVAVDANPMASLSNPATQEQELAKATNPILGWFGIDIDVPIIDLGFFSTLLYGDVGTVMPWLLNASGDLAAGPQFQSVFTLTDGFTNVGATLGVSGKALIVDYRLAFEYTQGAFEIGHIDQTYDRTRAQKATNLVSSLVSTSTNPLFESANMGIYGSAAASLFGLAEVKAEYKWPWSTDGGAVSTSNPDLFGLAAKAKADLLPYGIEAGLSYTRNNFFNIFTDPDNYNWLDEYTNLKGEATVPVGDFFKIRAQVGTAVKRDQDGAVVLGSNGKPTMYPVLTVETVIGM